MAEANWLFADGNGLTPEAREHVDEAIQVLNELAAKYDLSNENSVLEAAPGLYNGPVENEGAGIALALEAAATFLWGALWDEESRQAFRNTLLDIMAN